MPCEKPEDLCGFFIRAETIMLYVLLSCQLSARVCRAESMVHVCMRTACTCTVIGTGSAPAA